MFRAKDKTPQKPGRRRRALLFLLALVVVVVPLLIQAQGETTVFTSALAAMLFRDNLHEIVPGKFFRSAEMSPDHLGHVLREKGIKTLVDLRLGSDDAPPGQRELDIANKEGVKYVHVPLKGSEPASRAKLEELVSLYDTMELPALVHCSSGTHRSGLATAVWLIDTQNVPVDVAAEQLSARYGFFQWERNFKGWWSGKKTIDQTLWDFKAAHEATGVSFREWVESLPE